MKLERIELRNAGPFTSTVRVGPLGDGLNVLAAGNEAGKTTLLMAAARALFDRHTVTGDGIERLRPAGSSLVPDVTVVFETDRGRFKIHKTFLQSPTSELSEDRGGDWAPIAEGDAADGRVLELIGGSRPGRGASKAEHWGLLRYLWARQGESADWPAWDDDTGSRIRADLAQIDIDPLVERIANRCRDEQAVQFTTTGRVAKNSPLHIARETCDQLESEWADVRASMAKIEAQSEELLRLREEATVCDRRRTEAESKAAALTESLTQVELLRRDLERYQGEFDAARERLSAVHADRKSLTEAASALQRAEDEVRSRQGEADGALEAEKEARVALAALHEQAKALRTQLEAARKREARLREIQDVRGVRLDLEALRRRLESVRAQQGALEALRRKRAALPEITPRRAAALAKREQALRELEIRAEAVGLRIVLKPERDAAIPLDRDGDHDCLKLSGGEASTIAAIRSIRMSLPDWGELDITSGADEAVEIQRQMGESRAELERELGSLRVSSVDHARTTVERIKDLDRDIKAADQRLADLLEDWPDPTTLAAHADRLEADIEQRRAHWHITAAEADGSEAEYKAERAAIHAVLDTGEAEWAALQESIEARNRHLESCGEARAAATALVNTAKNRIAALQSHARTIGDRYPDGIDEAESRAQFAFVEAKAHLDVAGSKMPEDWEKLGPRHDRALRSAEQAAKDFHDLRRDVQKLETILEHAGSQGLYSRETRLAEALARANAERIRLETRALAARFLAGLIDSRKKAAVSTVLKPLEDRLSATFAEITGNRSRRVFLDETLQVSGIGPDRDSSYPFTQLSQGAREQLLLALRAAVALELTKSGPQILILDDVLVHTDAARQEHVLDFIGAIAESLQVLVVTCHPEQYQGLGTQLNISD